MVSRRLVRPMRLQLCVLLFVVARCFWHQDRYAHPLRSWRRSTGTASFSMNSWLGHLSTAWPVKAAWRDARPSINRQGWLATCFVSTRRLQHREPSNTCNALFLETESPGTRALRRFIGASTRRMVHAAWCFEWLIVGPAKLTPARLHHVVSMSLEHP